MSVAVSCPRCGGPIRPPDLMHSEWRCDACGVVEPLHTTAHVSHDVMNAVRDRILAHGRRLPLLCPWPLPAGWTVTGVAWAGDDRCGPKASAVALSCPAPLGGGPADLVFVTEEPGIGLGNHLAGLTGPDPGGYLGDRLATTPAQAKVKACGHPTPLWAIDSSLEDRSAYVGEAKGHWLYAVAWPASGGYLLAEQLVLQDLTDSLPAELVYGAPSPYLHGRA